MMVEEEDLEMDNMNTGPDQIAHVDDSIEPSKGKRSRKSHTRSESMREKYNKYWGDVSKINKLIYIAAVLDPRLRFEYVESELCTLYEHEKCMAMAQDVKLALIEMFKDYKRLNSSKKGVQSSENAQVQAATTTDTDSTESDNFREAEIRRKKEKMKKKSLSGGVDSKTELDKYIVEDGDDDFEDFDILVWWKINSPRFPLLSQMARDVLAIFISTVASESAFSTGGRVLDPFRNSLSPKVLEALICTQDWLKDNSFLNTLEETFEDSDKLDTEFAILSTNDIERSKDG